MVGQQKLLTKIKGHFRAGRVPKAWMFIGPKGCLDGDTLIDVPRNLRKYPAGVPIKELVGTAPYLYSFSTKKKRIVLARASKVWKTGGPVPVYKVTFKSRRFRSNYRNPVPNFLIGTGDHLVMLRRGVQDTSTLRLFNGYKPIRDLQPGDRIMPFFRFQRWGYPTVHLNNTQSPLEHRFILTELYGEKDGCDGHHKDGSTHNNSVGNLEWLTGLEHHRLHMELRQQKGTEPKYTHHPRGMAGKRQTSFQKMRARECGTKEYREALNTRKALWRRKEVLRYLFNVKGFSKEELACTFGSTVAEVRKAFKEFGIFPENNHVVEKVEFFGYRDVYDITVPKYHNFVANGVVVHNSGKTTIARVLATSVQCKHGEIGEPCIECLKNKSEFNIVEINSAKFTGKDELEQLLDGSDYMPTPGSRKRVYILDELQASSLAAKTLLLKYFEDAPSTTMWVICTTDPTKIPETLQSRCMMYTVPGLDENGVGELVRKGLVRAKSKLSSRPLIEALVDGNVSSPRLVLVAVEKYVAGSTPEEAALVEVSTEFDVNGVWTCVRLGDWEKAARHLRNAKPEDVRGIRNYMAKALSGILLDETEFNKRTDIMAGGIKALASNYGDDGMALSSLSAILYELCRSFKAYKL